MMTLYRINCFVLLLAINISVAPAATNPSQDFQKKKEIFEKLSKDKEQQSPHSQSSSKEKDLSKKQLPSKMMTKTFSQPSSLSDTRSTNVSDSHSSVREKTKQIETKLKPEEMRRPKETSSSPLPKPPTDIAPKPVVKSDVPTKTSGSHTSAWQNNISERMIQIETQLRQQEQRKKEEEDRLLVERMMREERRHLVDEPLDPIEQQIEEDRLLAEQMEREDEFY